ncbi:uncharacterized mitochondrial protein AtMg00810-like [Rutidosis leptorrhynchoides]|uniref:uncharacterized mitochondrial protein AtMg00810-like n=1 Tax=Rutidosis leptorrhynchoides TaxID=125765 RepID=UPI003A990456
MWNAKLISALLEYGFVQIGNDYSLYILSKDDIFVALLVYVDDIIITDNNNSEVDNVKKFLNSKFMIKDLGLFKYFLGIEIIKGDEGLCMSQRKYCLDLLDEFGMSACKLIDTPLEVNSVLASEASEGDDFLENITEFQKLIGKLIYLTPTRPDISYSVQTLSQHMHAPLQSHVKAALRVLRYLKGSPGKGIYADWGKCFTRRSVSGLCLFLCGSLVSLKSKKQPTVSRSSTESEYRSLAATTCEIIFVLKLLDDFGIHNLLPVHLFCDNKSALLLAANPVFHERSKHFETDVHIVREKNLSGLLRLEYVDSKDQVADVFTKGLCKAQHHFLSQRLGLLDYFPNKIEGGCFLFFDDLKSYVAEW